MKRKPVFGLVLVVLLFIAACMGLPTHKAGSRQQDKSQTVSDPIRPERSTLAVLKFINTSAMGKGDRYQPWEYGIASMITTDLQETAMFNIVDRERLNDILFEHNMQKAGLTDPAAALTIGKLVTARYILTGSFMVVRDQLRINIQVLSVEKGMLLGSASATGKVDQFFLVEKDIYAKVTPILQVMLDEEKQTQIMNTVETKSVDASLKNYAGETALIKADELKKTGSMDEISRLMKEAKRMFEEALQYDPDFERAKANISKIVIAIPMTL